MKIAVLGSILFLGACQTPKKAFHEVANTLPGEGVHVIKVDTKECIIAQNDDDQMAMQCFETKKQEFKHEMIFKQGN